MSIRPPLASRLIFALGGALVAVIWLWLIWFGITFQHDSPITMAVLGGLLAAIFGLIAYWGGRSTWLRADEDQLGYYPSIGSPRVVPRKLLAAIVRVGKPRSPKAFQFRARDGMVLFTADASFNRIDIERFAQYLGVGLQW